MQASTVSWTAPRRFIVASALAILPMISCASHASAQPVQFRWTSGFGQGTVEAMIRSADQSSIAFACPGGQVDPAPSISVQASGRRQSGQSTLQIVVDGRNHPVGLDDGYASGRGRAFEAAIVSAARALVASRATTFVAEIPEIGWRQTFSLLNVRDALGSRGGRTIVDGCGR